MTSCECGNAIFGALLIITLCDQESMEVWPCVNIMSSSSSPGTCETCFKEPAVKLALFYGQPYDITTLKPKEDSESPPEKNYNVCESCARLCQTYNTISHRKYDYYCKCKATVTNIRVSQPSKNTTTILRELLGNDVWIGGVSCFFWSCIFAQLVICYEPTVLFAYSAPRLLILQRYIIFLLFFSSFFVPCVQVSCAWIG